MLQKFALVKSEPVSVFARELGNNVPREKIIFQEPCKYLLSDDSTTAVVEINVKKHTITEDEIGDTPSMSTPIDEVFGSFVSSSSSSLSPATLGGCDIVEQSPQSNRPLSDTTDSEMSANSPAVVPSLQCDLCTEITPKTPMPSSHFLDPNEVVRVDSFEYDPMFVFWQVRKIHFVK
jgi:hypothetical protein